MSVWSREVWCNEAPGDCDLGEVDGRASVSSVHISLGLCRKWQVCATFCFFILRLAYATSLPPFYLLLSWS